MKTELDPRIKKIENILDGSLEAGRDRLFEHEVYKILNLVGFRTPRTAFVRNLDELGAIDLSLFPGEKVVCKLISNQLVHRFEYGGVKFIDSDAESLKSTFEDFQRIAGPLDIELAGMLIAEVIEGNKSVQNQLLLSLRQDVSFGPLVFVGIGGIGTEVYKQYIKQGRDLVIRTATGVNDYAGTEEALLKTLFYPIITCQTRIVPEPCIDGEKVHEALRAFALLAEAFSPLSDWSSATIEELEVNPIQITPEGELMPLDAMIRLSRNKTRPLHPSRSGINKLLKPETVLIIGASATSMNVGRIILRNILKSDVIQKDHVYVLHPEAEDIDGCKAFKSINDIAEKIDMAVLAVPANKQITAILEEIILDDKASSITLIPGGFGETEKGKGLDEHLQDVIRQGREKNYASTVVNGPNCLGIVSRPGGYNTFFLPEYKLPFEGIYGERMALISQSGAYLVTLVSTMGKLINPKYMITYGNQIDLTVTDYLINLRNDPDIDLFCLYVEGFKPHDGARFLKVAGDIIKAGKKIIMYKTGRTKAGAAAVASHTASMAGDYEVLHRVLSEAGIIMPDSLQDVEDAIKVFSLLSKKKVTGNKVGVFSNAGFECSVAADRLYSMELARFSAGTISRLHNALPTDIIDVNNPIDATPQTNAINYGKCLELMLEDDDVDCLVATVVPPTPFLETLPAGKGHKEDIQNENSYPNVTIKIFNNTEKPMVVSVDSGRLYNPAVAMMEDAGIPVFRKIDRAMKALDLFLRYQ